MQHRTKMSLLASKQAKQEARTMFLGFFILLTSLDIFIFKIMQHNVIIFTHFWPIFPFYNPLKTPEYHRFSGVFKGYKMGALARNGLINCLYFIYI